MNPVTRFACLYRFGKCDFICIPLVRTLLSLRPPFEPSLCPARLLLQEEALPSGIALSFSKLDNRYCRLLLFGRLTADGLLIKHMANNGEPRSYVLQEDLFTDFAGIVRLIFSGVDGIEAEDFIYHVRQRALSEGKLQDKQWILNFASACFVRDALRWHASLDARIQDDWALLQKALLARFRPVFRGIDGEECENFVAQVRLRALDEGKERDNNWIIANATASFVGEALRWYASLEPEIQDDWKMLQRAMFQRYPAPEFREESKMLRTPR